MSAKNTEKLEKYWVEELKNPPNTIRFLKDHRTKFVCVVCDDDVERVGDRKSLLERHSDGSVHQNKLKKFYGKKDHISVSSDDEGAEKGKEEEEEKKEKRRVGRPRKNPPPEKKKGEEEDHDEEESDSDRPSRKRERTKDIDLAYRPSAAARVANSVATLPMTRRESSVTPVPATPPARAGPPLAQSLFAERFSNIIDKVLMSDIATDACREEFVALLKTDGMQNQVRTQLKRGLREQGPSVLMEVLRELIEEEEKEHVRTFLKSDKAADMRADAYVRHLDGPQTQMFFAEGTQGFFNE